MSYNPCSNTKWLFHQTSKEKTEKKDLGPEEKSKKIKRK
uniref:Uncharacterized protein n=1 Tax=viral metagenome TaxID=1070528 RepID=A0A6C0J6Q5_9ZZZZ